MVYVVAVVQCPGTHNSWHLASYPALVLSDLVPERGGSLLEDERRLIVLMSAPLIASAFVLDACFPISTATGSLLVVRGSAPLSLPAARVGREMTLLPPQVFWIFVWEF